MKIDKLKIASDLRAQIGYYTELTVEEHQSGKITKKADRAWVKITNHIDTLAAEGAERLDLAYAVDLLARLTESIETYLDDDRWDGIDVMHKEIADSNKLIKKYFKRIRAEELK